MPVSKTITISKPSPTRKVLARPGGMNAQGSNPTPHRVRPVQAGTYSTVHNHRTLVD